MRIIVVLSNRLNCFPCLLAHLPINLWKNNPRTNGTIICKHNFCNTSKKSKFVVSSRINASQIGVANIPINPERLALNIAAGKFPLAKATITTEDDTVEGKVPKKNKAIQSSDSKPP